MDDSQRAAHLHPPDVLSDVHDVHVLDHNGRQVSGSWVCCMPCYWLRTNSSLHKASLTVVTLLVTSLLVASPVLFLISSVPANEQPYKDCSTSEEEDCFGERVIDTPATVCDTSECKDIARRIQFSLSLVEEPCRDFYKFSCGGWSEAHRAKGRRPRPVYGMDLSFNTVQTTVHLQIQQLLSLNASSGRFKKLGVFYSSCLMSFNKPVDMAPMYMMLDKLGGYLPPGSLGPNDITPLVANILNANGSPLLDVYFDRDINNKSALAIIIDLPRDFSSQRSFYGDYIFEPSYIGKTLRSQRHKRDIREQSVYYTYIQDKHLEKKLYSLERVVAGMLPKGMAPNQKTIDTQQISVFATEAEKLLPRRKELKEHLHDPINSEPYSLDELQQKFPFLTWKTLFKEIFPDDISASLNIYVISQKYLLSISEMISKYQKRVIQNALLALFARDFLYVIANHTMASDDKSQFCTHVTSKAFSQGVSALYLTQYSDHYLDNVHERAAKMFVQLRHALLGRVEKASWLDPTTRWAAVERLASMSANFIAWPPLRNDTFVDGLLSLLNVTNDFFENVISRHRAIRAIQLGTLEGQYMNNSWPYPFVVNAFYEMDDNMMVVPLALLTQPHFSRGAPPYVSFGTVGNVMAHEMLHALDLTGVHSTGALWDSSSSLSNLKSRLTCLSNHYQASARRKVKFMGSDMKIEFDGNATSEENAADVGGLRISWAAWRALGISGGASLAPLPLSTAKLFFISMAQLYCADLTPEDYIVAVENDFHMTPPERVNGLVRNSPQFSEVFQCSVGTPMNPSKKCIIW